ncbi:MAG: S24/S26 family peptidase [Clostridia bacterium]|nr:S24/S26 family peptidase [Clostridia bacterium]
MRAAFEDILARDGRLVYKTRGVSMEPMLRQDRDLVVIEPANGRLKPMDVAFYRRGSSYVLHRVIEVVDDGYLIRGDNTYKLERVRDADVIGVLTGFTRKGRHCATNDRAYLRYARFWNAVYPLRALMARARRSAVRAARKLGIRRPIRKLIRRG